jgi:eukaryotic-like serine/threonine-protein kinase
MSESNANPQWLRLREILADALELPVAERADFVARACSDDADLRTEVESLLRAHDADGAVDRVEAAVQRLIALDDESMIGQRVGPYRLVRVIDYGGMGAVFLGQREAGDFEQRVAIKLVRLGARTNEVVQRFLHERQILARLEHPNIARLLDGGITEDGLPFFAMEYVEGVPIHQHCDTNNLNVAQRLALFQQICAAVHYAHQNLVVHRDLKPANILVRADGQVKLLDFGIAKLIAPDGGTKTAATTLRWLTPEYAAPEQVRGEPVTTATDIYALGLILYELLAGRRAYEWDSTAASVIERVITEVEPAPPSTVVQDAHLRRELAGDIDTIVLHCLQKEPGRRYASAAQLAEDIERQRIGVPVLARPITFGYRASKFVRRHRAGLAAAAVIASTLIGGIAATSWQARQATEQSRIARAERDRARQEAAKAEQVSGFLVTLFKSSDPRGALGDTITARALLERGVNQLERDLAEQPLVRATLLDTIGRVYRNLGAHDRAIDVWQDALRLRRSVLGEQHPDVGRSLLRLAMVHQQTGRNSVAEPMLEEARGIFTRQLEQPSADLATVLSSLADIHMIRFDAPNAERLYRAAVEERRKAVGNEHVDVANDLLNLGMLLLHTNPAEADSIFSIALEMQRRLLPEDHADVFRALEGLGSAHMRLGKLDSAEILHREALAMRRRLLGQRHGEIAYSLENLATIAEKKGDLQKAEALYREAVDIKRENFAAGHSAIAKPLAALGLMLQAQNRCREAMPVLREALHLRLTTEPKIPPQIARLQQAIADCAGK